MHIHQTFNFQTKDYIIFLSHLQKENIYKNWLGSHKSPSPTLKSSIILTISHALPYGKISHQLKNKANPLSVFLFKLFKITHG